MPNLYTPPSAITVDDHNRQCLNDIYGTFGKPLYRDPTTWISRQSTREHIESIELHNLQNNPSDLSDYARRLALPFHQRYPVTAPPTQPITIQTIGRTRIIFATPALARAYTKWISAATSKRTALIKTPTPEPLTLTINNTPIHQISHDRWNLHDLWQAAGYPPECTPKHFRKDPKVKQYALRLRYPVKPIHHSKEQPHPGTYACRELALIYSAQISRVFHSLVTQALKEQTPCTT